MWRLGVSRYKNAASSPLSLSMVVPAFARLVPRSPRCLGVSPTGVRHPRAVGEDVAMAWSWAYLAVSLFGALFVANAFRPARHELLSVPSFFAGWYTGELPVWH